MARQRLPPRTGRPWSMSLPVRVLLVLADALRPAPEDTSTHPWIIDPTLIPVHDQSMGAM